MINRAAGGLLDDEQRRSHLVVHLATLVQRGATVIENTGTRAVVLLRRPANVSPNILMLLAGLVLFAITREPMFVLAALVAGVGWHRKRGESTIVRRVLVRVSESGEISECELGTA